MEAAVFSITLVHGVTSRKNVIFTFTVVKTCTYILTVEPNEPLLISSQRHNLQVSQEVWAYLQTNVFVWNGAKVKPFSDFFLGGGALRRKAGHGLLILEVSKSHTTTHHSR
jgi:hypothetical protein